MTQQPEDKNHGKGNDDESVILPPRPPQRAVARAVSNLGNTCYMNAVLQALAHAPELCMAMDIHGHRMRCPIYKENSEKMAARSAPSSRSSSPDNTLNINFDNNGELKSMYTYSSTGGSGTRKSTRRSTRTTNSPASNENGEDKSVADPNVTKFCALCETEHHMDRVHRNSSGSTTTTSSKPVSPMDFVHGFIDHVAPDSFRVGQQEDSHEFLRLLIEAMQKSCQQARTRKATTTATAIEPGSPQDTPTESIPSEAESESGDSSTNNDSNNKAKISLDTEYPFQLFSGKIESKVTCGYCHSTSSTQDPIEDLGLEVTPIHGGAIPMGGRRNTPSPVPTSSLADVSHALQRFACAEDLDAGYKCEKCGKVGKATKQMRLASIPPILTLHLKRFRYGASDPSMANAGAGAGLLGHGGGGYLPTRRSQRTSEVSQLIASSGGVNSSGGGNDWFIGGKSGPAKIEGPSEFKAVMDLKPYLTDELQNKHGNMLCRLFAVVVHVGKNSHSGHYLAYVRNIAKNEWWKMDDSRVSVVSTEEVLRSEAYMLFYRVVDHPYSKKLASQVKTLNDSYDVAAAALKVKEEKEAAAAAEKKDKEETEVTSTEAEENPGDAQSQNTSRTPDRSNKSGPAASVKKNQRKRKTPEYFSGEEWARSKTVIAEKNIAKFRDVEGKVSKHITFTPEFKKLLSEHAEKTSGKTGQIPSTGSSLLQNCGNNSTEEINITLLRCFLALSKNDGIVDFAPTPTPTMTTRSTAASRGKLQSAAIHVVDPTDDLL
uniref:ubiquitinyl hydrolase 1 n=1 Tax=Pseudo-nitzschia australis TaxID=44445 RepID=A0A7S4AR18_9STRA|mmetsp:Transcript_5686/g.11049  ORF Transcript_5686/g.11049 Transcript_5686/m.11049 type:complete len:771 (-) Transcript_5686:1065-3377(-)